MSESEAPPSKTLAYFDWRENWPFKVNVDESYPLAVRMAGEDLLVGFSTGGEGIEEAEGIAADLLRELRDADVEVESFSNYEVGRGASGEVLVFLISTPLAWSLAKMVELAINDPKKLVENLRYYGRLWKKLRAKFERLGVSHLSDSLIRQAALAEFAVDFPDQTPDVARVRLLSEVGHVPEAGWMQWGDTIVIIPAVEAGGIVIYVMDGLGSTKTKLSTLRPDADSLPMRDVVAGPLLATSELEAGNDPSLLEWGDEGAHVPEPSREFAELSRAELRARVEQTTTVKRTPAHDDGGSEQQPVGATTEGGSD